MGNSEKLLQELAQRQIKEAEDLILLGMNMVITMQTNGFANSPSGHHHSTSMINFRGKTISASKDPMFTIAGKDSSSLGGAGIKMTRTAVVQPNQKAILERIINDGPAKGVDIFIENERALDAIILDLLEWVYIGKGNNINVDLSNNCLKHIPIALFESTCENDSWKKDFWANVTCLNLNANNLKSLPENMLNGFSSLKSFSCMNNQLQTIPAKIAERTGQKWVQNTLTNQGSHVQAAQAREADRKAAQAEQAKKAKKEPSMQEKFFELLATNSSTNSMPQTTGNTFTTAFNAASDKNQGNNINSNNKVKSCADQIKELLANKNISRDQRELLQDIQGPGMDEQMKQEIIDDIRNSLKNTIQISYK